MITIIKNEKPNIQKIKFNCDNKINEKLDKYPMIADHLNKPNTTLFIGRQGSGKTSLLVNLIKIFKRSFHKIYVFMPPTSRKSLDDKIFDQLPKEQLYDELNEQSIYEVYGKVQENAENDLYSLIVYDDVQKSLKNAEVLRSLKNIIANQRHLKLVNWILLQNFISLDKSLRNIVNNVFLFKLNKTQMQTIYEELIEDKKECFEDINKLVFNEPYKWLFINLNTQRIYNTDFDELIIKDE